MTTNTTPSAAPTGLDPASQSGVVPPIVKPAETRQLAGRTTIANKALTSVAQAATFQTLNVTPDDVSVSTFDDSGKLGITVHTALRSEDVLRVSVRPDQTLFSLIDQARETIRERVQTISGHDVGRVDVYIDGISRTAQKEGRRLK